MKYKLKDRIPKLHKSVYVAPGAKIIGDVAIKENATIWFNAILRGDNDQIKIEEGSNIQDNVTIHVDEGYPVNIQKNVTVGHNAILHGCTIENEVTIGMGAIILNGAVIGEGSIVAAGALVKGGEEIAPRSIVAGIPASYKKTLTNEEIKINKKNNQDYIEKGALYKRENI